MTLLTDGDVFEKKYYSLFLLSDFPHYEQFWSKFIVPLTQRPGNIHAKTDSDLAQTTRGPKDVCISQLSYTAFRHVARVYDLKTKPVVDFDEFTEGLARLSSALDAAVELFERATNPVYDAWNKNHGKAAGAAWKNAHPFPSQLLEMRKYRNRLSHGNIVPCFTDPPANYVVPKIGKEITYLDWRKVTNVLQSSLPTADFDTPKNVLSGAWDEVVTYLDDQWKNVLLPLPVPTALPIISLLPAGGTLASTGSPHPQAAPAASGYNATSGSGLTAGSMASGMSNPPPGFSGTLVPMSGAAPTPSAGTGAAGQSGPPTGSVTGSPSKKTGCVGVLLLLAMVIAMGWCWRW